MAGFSVPRVSGRVLLALVVVAGLLVGGVGWWLSQRTYSTDLTSMESEASEAARDDVAPGLAARSLAALRDAVATGDVDAARALAPADDPAAGDQLAAVAENADALDVTGLGLRYLGESDADPAATPAPGEWSAAVEVTWRFDGFDASDQRVETAVDLVREGDRVAIAGLGSPPSAATEDLPGSDRRVRDRLRTPLWLAGPVDVRRSAETLVLLADSGGADPTRYDELARAAVPSVAAELPEWDRRLVVEVPADVEGLAAALGAPADDVAGVAAVSASPDGDAERGDVVHVYVNPEVFDPLGRRGAGLVMTHEAVHVATRAPGSPAPVWLVEGFADVVAVGSVGVDETQAAAQVAERVREDGPPDRLPGPAEFDTSGPHVGATYEGAWLACLVVREAAGADGLRRVYTRVDDGEDLATVLQDEAGLDVAGLTARWQTRLERVAEDAG